MIQNCPISHSMWSVLMSVCALTLCDHLLLLRVKIHIILIVLQGLWDRAACCRVLSTLLLFENVLSKLLKILIIYSQTLLS